MVSCHVERPLDDRVWAAFERVQARRPGGFRIAALMRPPHPGTAEPEELWLERARRAERRAPLGHHTHFGGPDTARPPRGEGEHAAAAFRGEAEWLRAHGLAPRFYCGGGWYADEPLLEALADNGYVDCSATSFPLPWLRPGDPFLRADAPCHLDLGRGRTLLELPTTHSLGSLVRSARRLPRYVHVHVHDWELVDGRRRALFELALRLLRSVASPLDLSQVAAASSSAPRRPLAHVLRR